MCWWDFRNRLGTAVSLLSVSWGDTFFIWVAGMPFLLCLVCKSLETFLAREFYSLFPAWSPSMSTWTFAYLMNPKSCPRSLLRVSMAWSWGCCTNRHRQYPESCSSGSEEHLRFRGTPSPQPAYVYPSFCLWLFWTKHVLREQRNIFFFPFTIPKVPEPPFIRNPVDAIKILHCIYIRKPPVS